MDHTGREHVLSARCGGGRRRSWRRFRWFGSLDRRQCLRAAEQLARSGAFDLLVIDLGGYLDLPLAAQTRLAGQALAHGTLILCLTTKTEDQPSLGSLVSVRVHARRIRQGDGRFVCRVRALKDKRRGPGWSDEVWCRGPDGVR